jgi:Flp pilus assembly pilin Flp
MDLMELLRQVARFGNDERGGESVEYALTSAVAVAAAAVAQRAMTDGVSDFAARALDPPSPAD